MPRHHVTPLALLSLLASTPAFAHHAEDEGLLEALLDHVADNWVVTLGVAVALAAAWLALRRLRPRSR